MKTSQPAARPPKQPGRPTDLNPDPAPQGDDHDAALPHERDESSHATDA
jgi:hypothetical protein